MESFCRGDWPAFFCCQLDADRSVFEHPCPDDLWSCSVSRYLFWNSSSQCDWPLNLPLLWNHWTFGMRAINYRYLFFRFHEVLTLSAIGTIHWADLYRFMVSHALSSAWTLEVQSSKMWSQRPCCLQIPKAWKMDSSGSSFLRILAMCSQLQNPTTGNNMQIFKLCSCWLYQFKKESSRTAPENDFYTPWMYLLWKNVGFGVSWVTLVLLILTACSGVESWIEHFEVYMILSWHLNMFHS